MTRILVYLVLNFAGVVPQGWHINRKRNRIERNRP